MNMKIWTGLWILLLSSVAAFGRADDIELAKKKIEEGKQFIAEEKYAEALEAFTFSYSIRPKPWVLFNIAMCNKALHRYVDAIFTFERFLQTETDPESTTGKLARSALAELESLVGKVRVVEAPPGASVYIDGEKVGHAPLDAPLPLDPGRHVVNVSKDRFKSLTVEVIVASGAEVEVHANLQQPKAEIKVACEGEKTVVFVDETAVGKCPYQGSVAAGVHELKVIEPGKETFVQTIEASAGSTLVIAVDLKPVIIINPPTFISDSDATDEGRPAAYLRISGIGALGLGAASWIVGGVFTAKWGNQYDEVEAAVGEADRVNLPYSEDEWAAAYDRWDTKKNKAKSFRAGFISAYAVGGGLVAAGVALLIAGKYAKGKDDEAAVSFVPSAQGVTVEF